VGSAEAAGPHHVRVGRLRVGSRAYRVPVALSDRERLLVAIGQVVRSGAEAEYGLQVLVERLLGHYGPLIARGHRFDLLYALAVQIATTELSNPSALLGSLEAVRSDIDLRDRLVHGLQWELYGAFERVLLRPWRREPPGPPALTVGQLEDLDARLRAHHAELMAYAAWPREANSR